MKEDGKLVAGGLLAGHAGEYWMSYGPIMKDWDNEKLLWFLQQLIDFAKSKDMVRLEIFPPVLWTERNVKGEIEQENDTKGLFAAFSEAGFSHYGRLVENRVQTKASRWEFVKDISQIKLDDLSASYSQGVRRALRKADGQIDVYVCNRDELAICKAMIDDSGRKHGVTRMDLKWYEGMWDVYGQDVLFAVARDTSSGGPMAGGVWIVHNGEMVYLIGGSNQKYQRSESMRVLQDAMIKKAIELGCHTYNFWGIEGFFENNPLLNFKSGFGGFVREYVGGFYIILSPVKYNARKILRRAKSLVKKLAK
jgi:lipid II:glycine glycyltransferase (peptidoglycan interpeptide bridge formation enzyme)